MKIWTELLKLLAILIALFKSYNEGKKVGSIETASQVNKKTEENIDELEKIAKARHDSDEPANPDFL